MLQPKAKLKKKLKAQLIKTAAENKIEKSAKKTVCLKGQTLIQNKPSILEGYFSASLEKALFCGLSWILSLSMFCTGFSNFYRIMNLQTTGKVLYWQMHTPRRATEVKINNR